MIKSNNYTTNFVLNYIGVDRLKNIELFIKEVCTRQFRTINSSEELTNEFHNIINSFYATLTENEIMSIKTYTGYNFRNINSILRGKWDYEQNGQLTKDIMNHFKNVADSIYNSFIKNQNLEVDLITYRGVNLQTFQDYGIYNIEQLKQLENQYFYESGFTSTSIIKNTSFFNKKLDWGYSSNIEIEYLIPKESDDGIFLCTDELSYSKLQNEYLIKSGSLSKIINVNISPNKTAHIKMVLIPEKIWNEADYKYKKKTKISN